METIIPLKDKGHMIVIPSNSSILNSPCINLEPLNEAESLQLLQVLVKNNEAESLQLLQVLVKNEDKALIQVSHLCLGDPILLCLVGNFIKGGLKINDLTKNSSQKLTLTESFFDILFDILRNLEKKRVGEGDRIIHLLKLMCCFSSSYIRKNLLEAYLQEKCQVKQEEATEIARLLLNKLNQFFPLEIADDFVKIQPQIKNLVREKNARS